MICGNYIRYVATALPQKEGPPSKLTLQSAASWYLSLQIQMTNAQIVDYSILSPIYSFADSEKILRIQCKEWKYQISSCILAGSARGKLDISRLLEEGGPKSKHCKTF